MPVARRRHACFSDGIVGEGQEKNGNAGGKAEIKQLVRGRHPIDLDYQAQAALKARAGSIAAGVGRAIVSL